jgi:hypothetical protein
LKTIDEVLATHREALMAVPGVVGTAIGRTGGAPCIRVFVTDATRGAVIPNELDGFTVRTEVTEPFRPT